MVLLIALTGCGRREDEGEEAGGVVRQSVTVRVFDLEAVRPERLLARKALINLDLMARWAAEGWALAVRSGFPVDDDGWPPVVRDVDGGYHRLDVEQTRARLRALAGE
ncbi:hypothetical protein GQ464_007495 [Rhodocaloribacter litoris]|uniref:hypothetical protein n=1 Tax=Rhodocaloribacter litoris TaxID=2558931 RepID=UPI00141F6BF7|nr:hypothetical protein [Rhodocaloribacter litoris]QXD16772.1 hypothetical protein GQ464_007495 [Rhodocaloribacter litoris]